MADNNIGIQGLRGLSIGCGEGVAPEMVLFEAGCFSRFEVMDIAGELLRRQEQTALERSLEGISYIKQDFNHVVLEQEAYDLVWAVGTVHHIENLESFFEQVRQALKENGIFVMREYVGPNRLQFSDEQLAIVNEILAVLPDKYKRTQYGFVKNAGKRVDVDKIVKQDPSEAVRSEDILPIMQQKLDVVHLANTGGTILHPLLNKIASNLEQDQDGEAILKTIILLERMLIKEGSLPSDYVFCIAKRKKL
jgi:SAM-dependent methyltransferase